MQVMVTQVVDGAIAALRQAAPSARVYAEGVAQGLAEPCFSVKCISCGLNRLVGDRFLKTHLLRIYYFPDPKGEPWRETAEALEKALPALELIEVDGAAVRATNAKTHIEDGVGVITLEYNFTVIRSTDEIDMDENRIEIKEVNR